MIWRRAWIRRVSLAVVLAILLSFHAPGAAAQDDLLAQLQTMNEINIWIYGAPTLRTENEVTSRSETNIGISNYQTIGIQDGFGAAPGGSLAWDGPRFSMQVAVEESEWQIAGEVAPDGRSIMELTAFQSLHYCDDPRGCTTPTVHEEARIQLKGPIPLIGTEDYGGEGPRWCYMYEVAGSDVGSVIQEASYTESSFFEETLIYPPDADSGLPSRISVALCGTSLPMPLPSDLDAKAFWHFQSQEVWEPTSARLADLVGACDLDKQEQWSPEISVWEDAAALQIEVAKVIAQDCIGPGCPSVTMETAFAWSPLPRTLVPGAKVALTAVIDSITYSEPHYGYGKRARILFYEDLGPIDLEGVELLRLTHDGSQTGEDALPQFVDVQWQVPPGAPGDRLALAVLLSGPAGCDVALILYHYQFVKIDQTPEPVETSQPDAASEDADLVSPEDPGALVPDEFPSIPDEFAGIPEEFRGIIAGLGRIGLIPGPESLTEALVGIGLPAAVISALSALGYVTAGGYRGDAPPTESSSPSGPPAGSPGAITMTDALGNQFDYQWDSDQGGYINPQTGGMLDSTLWNEYNRNLVANRAFSDRERERLENRETAFDRRADATHTDRQRERRQELEGALRNLEARGYALGEDGARAAAHARALAQRARAGERITPARALAIERFVRNREAGRTMADTGDRSEVTNWDVRRVQAEALARAVVTGRNEDGSTNWAGIGIRATVAIVSGGSSEKVFIPASAAYTYHDSRAQGGSRTESALSAVGGALLEVAVGRAAQGAVTVGGRMVGALGQVADDIAPGLTRTVRTGVRGLGSEFDQLARSASAAKQAVARRLGLGGRQALGAAERQMQWRVTKAIAEEADDDLVRIFRGNGRQTLCELERQGGLTQHQAQRIRQALATQVDGALDDGATAAMRRFQETTGIQPEEILVGDSGSTARGGAFSVGNSDFDRTVVPRFSQADIARFRAANGIGSDEQAVELLSRRFRATYQSEVEQALRQRTGLASGDVDFNLFDRIQTTGPGGEVYPFGYTNARQSGWGRTRVYRPGHQPYNTSGDALVDQNVIEIGRAGQPVPADPLRMNAREFSGVVRRQVAAGNRYTDATSLAKALERAGEPMRRLGAPTTATDTTVSRIARQIRNQPQQQAEILRRNGLTERQFVERARAQLNHYESLISQ